MRRMHLRRNSNAHKILKCAAAGSGILLLSLVSPQGGAKIVQNLIQGYFRRKSFEKQRFLRDLKSLQTRQLIDFRLLGDSRVKIILTKSGKEKVITYDLDSLKLRKPDRWDGKWRLLLFDIPHSHKRARDAFRQKLRDIGFYQLQKSVFIIPYPCEDEIDFVASIFDVRRYVLLIPVSNFEGAEKLKHYFRI